MFKKFLIASAAVTSGVLAAKVVEKGTVWAYNKVQSKRAEKAAEKAANGGGKKNKEQQA